MFDFVGSATDVAFKKGWSQYAVKPGVVVQPAYPPLNEHYFDWVVTLCAVDQSGETFRMAELGAGWAPWLVRAACAARQRRGIRNLELMAVEADEMHYNWVQQHFATNAVRGAGLHHLHGAVAPESGVIRFPRVESPDENYGASLRGVRPGSEFVEVAAYSVSDLLSHFTGPIDLMHVDIQGAEYDVIPAAMSLLKDRVKSIMIGTHISGEHHRSLAAELAGHGWEAVMEFPRNEMSKTEHGEIKFDDGFLFFRNPQFEA